MKGAPYVLTLGRQYTWLEDDQEADPVGHEAEQQAEDGEDHQALDGRLEGHLFTTLARRLEARRGAGVWG